MTIAKSEWWGWLTRLLLSRGEDNNNNNHKRKCCIFFIHRPLPRDKEVIIAEEGNVLQSWINIIIMIVVISVKWAKFKIGKTFRRTPNELFSYATIANCNAALFHNYNNNNNNNCDDYEFFAFNSILWHSSGSSGIYLCCAFFAPAKLGSMQRRPRAKKSVIEYSIHFIRGGTTTFLNYCAQRTNDKRLCAFLLA